ncbi:MAG TPA: type III secretion system protein [Paraburkholderia sp.]|nr:type III secretion system protein [Paraburkholderia sp.]
MKILRILTGTHAGIQARLTPGRYRIGKADDTDICITDWDDEEVVVELDEAGVMSARRSSASDADPSVVMIPDFVPFPFGTTVLCFGAEDATWPPDIQLLASMYNGTGVPGAPAHGAGTEVGAMRRRPGGRSLRVLGTIALVGALFVAGGSVLASVLFGQRTTPLPHSAPEVAATLRRQLHEANLDGLRVRPQGGTVVIDGMVDDASQDIAARSILGRTGFHAIARQYDVAHADVASIDELLATDGVHVRYAGNGVFEVAGIVPSLTRFEDALNRLRADLDGNVKRLDVDVTEAPAASAVVYTAMLDVGNTRYVQTQDGVKHVFVAGAGNAASGPRTLRESITPSHGDVH